MHQYTINSLIDRKTEKEQIFSRKLEIIFLTIIHKSIPIYESTVFGVQTRSDTNPAVQISDPGNYLCSKNKGADQLRG